jgi:predicted glycoside hydrolase/deacetylase ChbG (UPF0249 family)
MKKLIVTADDFGVVKIIDQGIIKALKAKRVNSVAAFSNYGDKGGISRRKAECLLKDVGEQNVQLGIHLTISS